MKNDQRNVYVYMRENFYFLKMFLNKFFKFYGKLIDQDKKGLFKYLLLSTLEITLISTVIYSTIIFFAIILSYDFGLKGHFLGMEISIIPDKIPYFFYCISTYFIYIAFVNMFQRYVELYSDFNKWNYGEKIEDMSLSQGFKEIELFNKTLYKVITVNWIDRKSYNRERTEYLHLLKYDKQKLRSDTIDELL